MTKARCEYLEGVTKRIKTGCGWLYVTVNFAENDVFEVFLRLGKAGLCPSSQLEVIGRLISLSLRNGVKVDDIIKTMQGVSCEKSMIIEGGRVSSCGDAISKLLKSCVRYYDKNLRKDDR